MGDDFRKSGNEIEEGVTEEKFNDDEQEEGGHSEHQQDSSFLIEMNLITVLLSSVCAPGEDCLNLHEDERKSAKINEEKACISRIQNRRRRVTSETKCGRRPSQRVQPIKELSHCRKM